MIALSVFVFRPRPHDRGIRPPYAELIGKQCAVAPENDLIPAECSCEKAITGPSKRGGRRGKSRRVLCGDVFLKRRDDRLLNLESVRLGLAAQLGGQSFMAELDTQSRSGFNPNASSCRLHSRGRIATGHGNRRAHPFLTLHWRTRQTSSQAGRHRYKSRLNGSCLCAISHLLRLAAFDQDSFCHSRDCSPGG
jgi:hypothetical protein